MFSILVKPCHITISCWTKAYDQPCSASDSPISEDVQKLSYLNEMDALKKYLQYNSGLNLNDLAMINKRDANALMTAAEFESVDVLLVLLQYLKEFLEDYPDEKDQIVQKILHQKGGGRFVILVFSF